LINSNTLISFVAPHLRNYASLIFIVMKNRLPAALAFIGAPFLGIEFYRNIHSGDQWDISIFTSLCDILYMAGWICTMFALIRIKAAGTKNAGRIILYVQTLFLFVAASSDVVTLFQIPIPHKLFFIWDLFWPISNCMMLVTGIAIAAAGTLKGWRRWVPLVAGLWLPLTIVVKLTFPSEYMAIIGGTYSIVLWTVLAWVAFEQYQAAHPALVAFSD
jgi:hypothetical protein